jgi:hypothetical protein
MYSIEISDKNGCLSISEDFEIIITGINNANRLDDIRNYLDSTNGELNLTNLPNEPILIQVYSPLGKLLLRKETVEQEEQLDLWNLGKGLHYLRTKTE